MNQTPDATHELTWRGIALGALITLVFTASNVYLGLKVGLTFASSIPATVISMAVFRILGRSNILENNMVQTQASAAGTLSCVFAAIPGLILIGYWQNFPFWQTMLITAAGGMTGVLFTIPLRRALVSQSSLPYPEGVACAKILHASSPEGDQKSLKAMTHGGVLAALVTFCSGGLRLIPDGFSLSTAFGNSVFRLEGSYSLALLATGYLVGIGGGLAMLLGVFIGWGIAVPWLGATTGNAAHLAGDTFATGLWLHKVRFLGAGTIAVAAVWTLATLAGPVARGLSEALSIAHRATDSELDRDLPPSMIKAIGAFLFVILAGLFTVFLWPLLPHTIGFAVTVGAGLAACVLLGFLVASACGYMAGIIGSSSSPISGVSIIAIVIICLCLLGLEAVHLVPVQLSSGQQRVAIAFALFVLTALTASAAISNDNLQDLKTGQLVGASPWKQETALLIGCIVGAVVIPPILNVLYQAYGFVGALPRPDMDPSRALAAPQPALMVAIAQGIMLHKLDWEMIVIGVGLGVVLIALDRLLRARNMALPPLAVGMGIYLPAGVSVMIGIGAIVSWVVIRTQRTRLQEGNNTGTMIASGFIVGESLTGVVLAALSGVTGHSDVLAIPVSPLVSEILGAMIFTGCVVWFAQKLREQRG